MSAATFRILIIDELHPNIFPLLESIGVEVVYKPNINPTDVKQALADMDGLIVRSKMRITSDTIALATKLKFVARAGAGLDNIEVEKLEQMGIPVLGANEGNRQAVGEHALGMLLSLMRNMNRADKQVREKVWLREENRGEELGGKTIGVIGYGNMGQSFARLLTGFGCRIMAYDRFAPEKIDVPAEVVSLEALQAEADVITLHIPYIPDNHHLINDRFLKGLKKQVWFINTSRGEVVDQEALVQHLKTGTIKGAALDVLENEKLKTLTAEQQANFNFLASADNVLLTPHIAGWTHESYVKINEVLVEKIKQVLHGE
ncbi:NAD(P)-dependent oxidoreductase [Pontibacter harenae]|uniref:NAD(P)-dependent oxidoreductase n=1 Tax=Pontibacter harenae TaxID=2894083 RepID=UPI001E4F6450|nr:NAD(P)-dependent oxidoreductase [Pontibacter harenae]MCC9165655.1 NAD(P)-binding domain-containing protein [Pontibacter harenae]